MIINTRLYFILLRFIECVRTKWFECTETKWFERKNERDYKFRFPLTQLKTIFVNKKIIKNKNSKWKSLSATKFQETNTPQVDKLDLKAASGTKSDFIILLMWKGEPYIKENKCGRLSQKCFTLMSNLDKNIMSKNKIDTRTPFIFSRKCGWWRSFCLVFSLVSRGLRIGLSLWKRKSHQQISRH